MMATTIPLDQWFLLFCYDLFAHELVQAGVWEEFMELSEKKKKNKWDLEDKGDTRGTISIHGVNASEGGAPVPTWV